MLNNPRDIQDALTVLAFVCTYEDRQCAKAGRQTAEGRMWARDRDETYTVTRRLLLLARSMQRKPTKRKT